jgi:hypothetical protein
MTAAGRIAKAAMLSANWRGSLNFAAAGVHEHGGENYANGDRQVVAPWQFGGGHRPLPVAAGSPAADHASHPPVKTLTLLTPRVSNAPATSRLS